MNLARLSIKRPTFIFALLMTFIILGLVSLNKLSVRMFPDVEFPYVIIATTYKGAGVTEIEQLVTKPIEDALSGVSGLKHSYSTNQDNVSVVFGEFELTKNSDVAIQEVRDKIGQIKNTLPKDIDEPLIIKADMNLMPIVMLNLKSESMSSKELYDFADDIVSKDLTQVSGVSRVNIIGGSKREVHINADMKKLKEYELTLTTLANRIKSNSLNIPAGKINRGSQEISFRTIGEFKSVKQINDVVINFTGNDKPVVVKDIAKIEDSVIAETSIARLDTKTNDEIARHPSLLLAVYRQAKGNDIVVSDGIIKKMGQINERYKKYNGSPKLTLISDQARGVRMNIDNVKFTIIEGIFLAIVVVYFFLGSWRSTLITVLALPNSLIGSFIFMYVFGFSLNVLSLMSLSLAIGLLIDDAIVVRENIFRHYEGGSNPVKSAIDGTNEVTLAVIATTGTVVAVFLPIAFLSGIMGKFFKEFGLTVVFAMIISAVDALTIAPMLSAYIIQDRDVLKTLKKSKLEKVKAIIVKIFRHLTVDWFNAVFLFCVAIYKVFLTFIVKKNILSVPFKFAGKQKNFIISWKFMTLIISFLIFISTVGVAKKFLRTTFMPASEWGEFNINLTAQPGTSLEQMDRYAKDVEIIVMNDPNIKLISSTVGSSGMFSNLSNEACIYVKMIPNSSKGGFITKFFGKKEKDEKVVKRTFTTSEIKDYFRKILNDKYGDKLEISIVRQHLGGGNRSEFVVELTGTDDIDILYNVAQKLINRYKSIPKLVDVHSNYKPGKPEIRIEMDAKKMERYGVSSAVVGNEIRAMIDGVLAGKFREHGLEYDIRVQYENNEKDIAKVFNSIYISNVNNKLIKLNNVAYAKLSTCPTQIFRKDRTRYVTVEGNVALGGTIGEIQKDAVKIFNELKSELHGSDKYKDIVLNLSGNAEDMKDMFKNMIIAVTLSIVFIFMILASLYESIITPFTIMTALPLAVIGGIIALLIFDQPIDMFTMIGMIMLLGIVAKNSILLVDYAQQQMRIGLNIDDSIIKAGIIRLRPILMTSFALIASMLPTALGLSEVGHFRRGMGIVVIGGVISSTILTLILIPSIFEYMDKIRRFLRKVTGRPDKRMMDYTDSQQLSEKYL
ncbi:MAG: efflux RND transporter permease subunit [Endomicrobium sp.]|jgi:HAE1 family hydrophobic/amphiphilic exporter-1|nr:efflux RND transporter permease subunit [Endomicrobium sp.]